LGKNPGGTRVPLLVDLKGFLPVDEVHVPHQLEAGTLLIRRSSFLLTGKPFQLMRYCTPLIRRNEILLVNEVLYPVNQKEILPVNEEAC
jgi:hypothetical protein